jgi:hypothetical protein
MGNVSGSISNRGLGSTVTNQSPVCGGDSSQNPVGLISSEFLGLTFYRITEDMHNRITENGSFRID